MTDASTQRAIDTMAREMARMQRELDTLKRGQRRPQLANSSTTGTLEFTDPETGETRLRIGRTADGFGLVTEGGDPPTAPTAPVVAAAPLGLMVQWDGALANEVALSAEFDHVSVFAGESDAYGDSTFAGTIARSGGVLPIVPLEVGTTYHVWLVGVTTGGVQGDPSESASGVPESVGGVPAPGSITETEIADDAISTPALQAEAVTALKIAANAIEAGHITAGAVDASKLAATLVLASTIIAGDEAGARVEIDQSGLRKYNAAGELQVVLEGDNAAFTGTISGSAITGSNMTIGDPAAGNYGVIEETAAGQISMQVVSASTAYGQVSALDAQAEYSVWGSEAADAPAAGILAHPAAAELLLFSDSGDTANAPRAVFLAREGEAFGFWASPSGSRITLGAAEDFTALRATPPTSTIGSPEATDGALYALRDADDAPVLAATSPYTQTGPGAGMRSALYLEGGTSTRDYGRVELYGRRIVLSTEFDSINGGTVDAPGVLFLNASHSIAADRHAPVTTYLQAQPTGSGSESAWIDFTEAQFPSLDFTTAWSGRVKITIQQTGASNVTAGATLSTSFGLSGGTTLAADLSRSAMSRAAAPRGDNDNGNLYAFQQQQVFFLDLAGLTDFTLTPAWRTSGAPTWGTSVYYDMSYNTSITVENLM